MIREAISTVAEGGSLTEDQAAQVMDEIMSGEATPRPVRGIRYRSPR